MSLCAQSYCCQHFNDMLKTWNVPMLGQTLFGFKDKDTAETSPNIYLVRPVHVDRKYLSFSGIYMTLECICRAQCVCVCVCVFVCVCVAYIYNICLFVEFICHYNAYAEHSVCVCVCVCLCVCVCVCVCVWVCV